jgi:hypothetical protein
MIMKARRQAANEDVSVAVYWIRTCMLRYMVGSRSLLALIGCHLFVRREIGFLMPCSSSGQTMGTCS